MPKIKRLELLLLSINSKKHFTLKELADEFSVSTRTIQRDLIKLIDMGLPIVSEFGPNGGYRLENDRILPPIGFTEMEALAILQILEPMQKDGSPFKAASKTAKRKFLEYLPDDALRLLETRKERLLITYPLPNPSAFLDLFIEASIKQQMVSVDFSQAKENDSTTLQPIGLYSLDGTWYCPAYCYSRNDYFVLNLELIEHASILSETIGPKDFSNITILDWTVQIRSKNHVPLHVLLTPAGVKNVMRHPVLSQLLSIHQDESGELTGSVLTEELSFLLKFLGTLNEDASVIQPQMAINSLQNSVTA